MIVLNTVLKSVKSRVDRTFSLSFDTEELTPEQFQELGSSVMFPGVLAFNKNPFKKEQLDAIEGVELEYEDTGKSPSKRLRAILYVYWSRNDQGYADFEDFYRHMVNKLIIHFKNKIDELDD